MGVVMIGINFVLGEEINQVSMWLVFHELKHELLDYSDEVR